MKRAPALLVALSLLTPTLSSRAGAAPTPRFSGEVDVVEVEVPVEVRDRDGNPIRGLTRDDFRLFDEGDEQEISRFSVVDLAQEETGVSELPAAAPAVEVARPRHLLLLFDLTYSNPLAVSRARAAAKTVVLESLHASDLVGVAVYSVEMGPRLLVTFTPDRAQVARALDSLSFDRSADYRARDPLRFMVPFAAADTAQQAGAASGESRQVRSEIEAVVAESQQIVAEIAGREARRYERTRASNWTRGLGELVRYLAAIEGRKQVLLFSEGFDSRLLMGRIDLAEPDVEEENLNAYLGQVWRVDSDARFGNTELLSDATRLATELGRADCVINAVDISGLTAAEDSRPKGRNPGQDGLFFLANESGGQLFTQENDLAAQFREVLARTEVTYLLTFQARDVPPDGSWRRLRVELEGHRGLRTSYRPGWYAPRPFRELHPFERDLLAADTIALGEVKNEIELSILAAAFRATQTLAYVPVILEIDGRSLLAGSDARRAIDLYAYVTSDEGEFLTFFHRSLAIDPRRGGDVLENGGLKYYGHFELGPGSYQIRVLVREDETGRRGAGVLRLVVPDYARGNPTLLPPFFFDDPGRRALVRERTAGDGSGTIVYPFVVGGEPYVPQAAPSFRAGERPQLCVSGYNLGGGVRVEGTWLTPAGERPLDLAVEPRATGNEDYRQWVAKMSLGGLSAGEHRFRLSIVDPESGRSLASAEGSVKIEG